MEKIIVVNDIPLKVLKDVIEVAEKGDFELIKGSQKMRELIYNVLKANASVIFDNKMPDYLIVKYNNEKIKFDKEGKEHMNKKAQLDKLVKDLNNLLEKENKTESDWENIKKKIDEIKEQQSNIEEQKQKLDELIGRAAKEYKEIDVSPQTPVNKEVKPPKMTLEQAIAIIEDFVKKHKLPEDVMRAVEKIKSLKTKVKKEEEEIEKTSAKMTEKARDFISRKIKKLMDEGYPQEQAIAIAYSMARERGYDVPETPKKSALVKSIYKLAEEMIVEDVTGEELLKNIEKQIDELKKEFEDKEVLDLIEQIDDLINDIKGKIEDKEEKIEVKKTKSIPVDENKKEPEVKSENIIQEDVEPSVKSETNRTASEEKSFSKMKKELEDFLSKLKKIQDRVQMKKSAKYEPIDLETARKKIKEAEQKSIDSPEFKKILVELWDWYEKNKEIIKDKDIHTFFDKYPKKMAETFTIELGFSKTYAKQFFDIAYDFAKKWESYVEMIERARKMKDTDKIYLDKIINDIISVVSTLFSVYENSPTDVKESIEREYKDKIDYVKNFIESHKKIASFNLFDRVWLKDMTNFTRENSGVIIAKTAKKAIVAWENNIMSEEKYDDLIKELKFDENISFTGAPIYEPVYELTGKYILANDNFAETTLSNKSVIDELIKMENIDKKGQEYIIQGKKSKVLKEDEHKIELLIDGQKVQIFKYQK